MRRYRWGDHDRHLGPLTYTTKSGFEAVGFRLKSRGDDDDEDGVTVFGVHLGRVAVFMPVPHWVVRPAQEWVDTSRLVAEGGPSGYWQSWPREYGVTLTRSGAVGERYDSLTVDYGRQTHSSETTKSWYCFLPWQTERLVRTTLLTPDLEVHHERREPREPWLPRRLRRLLCLDPVRGYDPDKHEERRRLEDSCPRYEYRLRDTDGTVVVAKARLVEREWRRGEGPFQWLGWVCKPTTMQSYDVSFSSEVGPRKGSWKGGTLSMSGPAVTDDLDASVRRAVWGDRRRDLKLEVVEGPLAVRPKQPSHQG